MSDTNTESSGATNPAIVPSQPDDVTVYVIVSRSFEDVHADDVDAAGVYKALVLSTVPKDQLANAALDAFHSQVPIKVLDDFCISTYDKVGMELVQSDDVESYALTSEVRYVDKVTGGKDMDAWMEQNFVQSAKPASLAP